MEFYIYQLDWTKAREIDFKANQRLQLGLIGTLLETEADVTKLDDAYRNVGKFSTTSIEVPDSELLEILNNIFEGTQSNRFGLTWDIILLGREGWSNLALNASSTTVGDCILVSEGSNRTGKQRKFIRRTLSWSELPQ